MQINSNKNEKITERILLYLDSKGISKYKFSKDLGVSNGFLDKKREIGTDKYANILEYFPDINPEWLLTGKGEMLRDNNNVCIAKKDAHGIPLIPASAMAGMFSGDVQILEHECDRYVVPVFKGADFLISVKGSSMYPKYNSGDIVACKKLPLDTFFQWNKVYVLDTDQGPLIKRILEGSDNDAVQIVSDNDKYKPFELKRVQIYNIALVLGVIRLE